MNPKKFFLRTCLLFLWLIENFFLLNWRIQMFSGRPEQIRYIIYTPRGVAVKLYATVACLCQLRKVVTSCGFAYFMVCPSCEYMSYICWRIACSVWQLLDENSQLIQTIQESQNKGRMQEVHQYQQLLHRNLVYLASIADSSQNIQSLLPVSRAHTTPTPRRTFRVCCRSVEHTLHRLLAEHPESVASQ